eukprot:PhM_4_TR9785/c2_g1_i1/m.12311
MTSPSSNKNKNVIFRNYRPIDGGLSLHVKISETLLLLDTKWNSVSKNNNNNNKHIDNDELVDLFSDTIVFLSHYRISGSSSLMKGSESLTASWLAVAAECGLVVGYDCAERVCYLSHTLLMRHDHNDDRKSPLYLRTVVACVAHLPSLSEFFVMGAKFLLDLKHASPQTVAEHVLIAMQSANSALVDDGEMLLALRDTMEVYGNACKTIHRVVLVETIAPVSDGFEMYRTHLRNYVTSIAVRVIEALTQTEQPSPAVQAYALFSRYSTDPLRGRLELPESNSDLILLGSLLNAIFKLTSRKYSTETPHLRGGYYELLDSANRRWNGEDESNKTTSLLCCDTDEQHHSYRVGRIPTTCLQNILYYVPEGRHFTNNLTFLSRWVFFDAIVTDNHLVQRARAVPRLRRSICYMLVGLITRVRGEFYSYGLDEYNVLQPVLVHRLDIMQTFIDSTVDFIFDVNIVGEGKTIETKNEEKQEELENMTPERKVMLLKACPQIVDEIKKKILRLDVRKQRHGLNH